MTDVSGNVQAQYSYDQYGRATKVQGALTCDFQYAGYYFHAPSGLNLTLNRAYNPGLGRWFNRVPDGEQGGINLYDYVGNNPLSYVDPSGLIPLVGPIIPSPPWQGIQVPQPPLPP